MSWDYDKLFAVGNIVGLRNKTMNYVFVHRIHPEEVNNILEADGEYSVDWEDYKNSNLSWSGMEIEYIIRPNEDWSAVERPFLRNRDMPKPMPKLENGMFVRITDWDDPFDDYGVVVNNKIVYRTGGWCDVEDELPYITAVWNNARCFDECGNSAYKPIWEKN